LFAAVVLFLKLNLFHNHMTENLAARARKKSLFAYIVLTLLFVAIFGGITLVGLFISRLST
jgi:hypothetical protein